MTETLSASPPNGWQTIPGNWDALHATQRFPSSNRWGIPTIQRTTLADTPAWLAPYRTVIRSQTPLRGATHFFLHDYRFETVWNRPQQTWSAVSQCPIALSPDFSLYRDWPLVLQLWNVHRNRWCGAYWQSCGLTVIPTLSWSTPESYEFCYCGVELHSLVAISTLGVKLDQAPEYAWFMAGFREMLARLEPSRVLCYGPAPRAAHALADVVTYPTGWKGVRHARRRGYGKAVPRWERAEQLRAENHNGDRDESIESILDGW
ncbi:MAG: DUF4417 domain-containing protein [Anaerolineales bacterium]|nr:DUF4417 domain-containing protein [Anaerolineales bacterium]